MIKLFVSDLDGTLLNENHEVSQANIDAVKEMRKHGISFLPASGRSYLGLQAAISALHIHPKCICLNGAEFYDNDGNRLISNPISIEKTKEIQVLLKTLDCYTDYYCEDAHYLVYGGNDLEAFFLERFAFLFYGEKLDDPIEFLKENEALGETKTIARDEEILDKTILKIELVFKTDKAKAAALEKLNEIDDIITTSSHELNLEINSIEATKGHMIEQVCETYGYDKEEVVVVGDGINDIPMLEKFPNSYAMGQASDVVKKAAMFEADSNSNDGVAKLIHEIIANNK
ncbi:Cof subfamily protein (haloacid dehalogenase superfamily) [Breznakia sp. PF5-3]|uniref:Cof-type HAD-IIB family hydrolase n=1 Tax=unclassified Breznakia TaxID=2623764 RepID=UPI00240572E6|nr:MULTISPECIES: Cof-type HAD-IIB family hydrolase [unclassified Breznakia]MDF9825647.1 Cof subfamily protein (haloacid dehalogenase superfamily) [Breznakia sp. PM6-1]MDF9836485.1 Cof subfamily protein (haloacid dehalogenase superfamily) [Breznakia sp. PF5-3]MDF9838670.1 Cof subfamily protein (haloacid dehalogenase superfamily) [Breznakia sp. PFB2-8]MDF9860705.1 Cof subfamily protein (haloacid dehalogenase superfamily) [Breznakia sp. PH5-24]